MKFKCPGCGQHLEAGDELRGSNVQCPLCQAALRVPRLALAERKHETVTEMEFAARPEGASAAEEARRGGRRGKWGVTIPWRELGRRSGRFGLKAGVVVAGLFLLGAGYCWVNRPSLLEVRVFPEKVDLSTAGERQSLVVQAVYADGVTRDVTDRARFVMGNTQVAAVERGVVRPLADGRTELVVAALGRKKTLAVQVRQAQVKREVSFKLDVMPVLMKAGCNSGGCHGSSRGKEGFRLSLFGYDAEGDYFRLTRESIGRRIDLSFPEESLILEKGLARVPHGGGERFTTNSPLYHTLLAWVRTGARQDGTNVAAVTGVEMMPRQVVLEGTNVSHRLSVVATYSDGSRRDVTTLAVFLSNNDGSARVSEHGLVTSGQRGEAFVTARFDTHTVGAQVIVVPRDTIEVRSRVVEVPKGLNHYRFPKVARNNYIDDLVFTKLKKLRVTPSGLCDDASFLRRVYLDVVGKLPTPEEVRAFLADAGPDKRERVVDGLLKRQEFTDLWVMKFAELLQIRSDPNAVGLSGKEVLFYYNWLQEKFGRNEPIDGIVRELLTASGSSFRNPAAAYFRGEQDTLKMAENAAQVFMGMRIQCAQCHNHPFDRWTMNDYYSFAAFFQRIGRKPTDDPREAVIYDRTEGEIAHPVNRKVMAPKFLGAETAEIAADQTRRGVLAEWIASPRNPYFARNLANLVWAHFMGRGIIDPVDDVRVSNPASNPELLEELGKRFTDYRYDFRRLVRDICTSRVYQLSTRVNRHNQWDTRNFSRAPVRRLRAEVILDCINQVTGTEEKFQGLPKGARAVQIADGAVNNYFLTTFGRATRESVCSCEVRMEPNLSQALHLLNGESTHQKVMQGGVVARMLKEGRGVPQVLESLYLRTLSRLPTAAEQRELEKELAGAPEESLNDLFWALLNSKEFIFQH